MPLLGVNIDHVATVREVRGVDYPSIAEAVRQVEAGGADFITAHLREDRRHIQDSDVDVIMATSKTWLNLEVSLAKEMLQIACAKKPRTVCLVPEKREELTTEGGLDVAAQLDRVKETTSKLSDSGIDVSLFIEAEATQVEASKDAGAAAIELHTGAYANAKGTDANEHFSRLRDAAKLGNELGLQVNMGHGLTIANLAPFIDLPDIVEYNIGHSIVADALFVGLAQAVSAMKAAIEGK